MLPLLLLILLIASLQSVAASGTIVINVDPLSLEVDVDDTCIVDVNITNVEAPGVYGYEFRLYYTTTLLNVTEADYPDDHFLSTQNNFPTPIIINYEQGYVLFGCILLGDVPGSTGSGILATINFTGTSLGVATLEIKNVTLLDPDGTDITDYTVTDGAIEVVPEFTPALIIFIFMTITLVAISLRKLAASKKHNAFTAKT